ncbi:winged helix-turn-helix transcriptional regulator [Paenibacillus sp. LMG 31456]|uniref:Winged helix-turn-helix transcriptional regulator n=1 Tax=Paenibacillus foliorum TaxID=2654974 RepID=A0A972K4Y2_9BACL|nr:winged helix-turn-helix domain-containing protein [Paenibacillus foliorum]NOU97433.1 winged helix-turn-helix transcriptional regulator [Paenibacillus foliorum]
MEPPTSEYLTKSQFQSKIIEALENNPDSSLQDISEVVNLKQEVVKKVLTRLVNRGIVIRIDNENEVIYRVNKKLYYSA